MVSALFSSQRGWYPPVVSVTPIHTAVHGSVSFSRPLFSYPYEPLFLRILEPSALPRGCGAESHDSLTTSRETPSRFHLELAAFFRHTDAALRGLRLGLRN